MESLGVSELDREDDPLHHETLEPDVRTTPHAHGARGVTKLTIVVPTLNEAENVRPMVEALLTLEIPGVQQHVLVVDNESPDGTGEIADDLAREHPGRVGVEQLGVGNGGLGTAYRCGFRRALDEGADFVVQMDCDFSHPPHHVLDLVETLRSSKADMVLGSRYLPGSSLGDDWPWWRYGLSAFANGVYIKRLLSIPLADATGGFRIWRRKALLAMDPWTRVHSTGYVFQVEMAFLAHRLGLRLQEVPIAFPQRRAGTSKMSFGIQLEAAWRVFDVRRRHADAKPVSQLAPKRPNLIDKARTASQRSLARRVSWSQGRYLLRHFERHDDASLARETCLSVRVVQAFLASKRATRTEAQRGRIAKHRPEPPPFASPGSVLGAATKLTSRPLERMDLVLCALLGLLSLVLYGLTAARTVTGEDAGELIAAAHGLGVPHPPGYPLWTLLGHAFDSLLPWGTVAWRVTLASAVPAALANACLLAVALKTLRSRPVAVIAAAMFAVSLTHWSQAVIPEVYGLNTLFIAASALLLVRLAEKPTTGRLWALAAVAGLSLTNHTSAAPIAAVTAVGALAVAPRLFTQPKVLLGALVAAVLPLGLYAYLPWASARDPYLDWGNPETWDAFVAHVTRAQYTATQVDHGSSANYGDYLTRLGILAKSLGRQFGSPWMLLLAPLGFAWLFIRQTGAWLYLLTVGWLCSVAITQFTNYPFDREHVYANQIFFIPAWLAVAWLLGGGLDLLASAWRERVTSPRVPTLAMSVLGLAVVPIVATSHWDRVDRSETTLVAGYGKALLDTMEPGALFLPSSDHSSFAPMYWQGVEDHRLDVVIGDRYGRIEPSVVNPLLGPEDEASLTTLQGDARRDYLERVLITRWQGPVYLASLRDMSDIPGLQLEPVGPLFRVMTTEQASEWWAAETGTPAASLDLPAPEAPVSMASETVCLAAIASLPEDDHPNPPGLQQWTAYEHLDLDDPVEGLDFTVQMVRNDLIAARGLALLRAGRLNHALIEWSRLHADLAPLKQTFNNVASALAEDGHTHEAMVFYTKALEEDPVYAMALRNKGRVLRRSGRLPEAIEVQKRLVAAHAERDDQLELARWLTAADEHIEALAEYESLAKSRWRDPLPWREAGDLLAGLGDLTKARVAYRESLDREPGQQGVLDALERLDQEAAHGRHGAEILGHGQEELTAALSSDELTPTAAAWAALNGTGPDGLTPTSTLPAAGPEASFGPPTPHLPGGGDRFLPALPQMPDPARDVIPHANVPVEVPIGGQP